MKRWLILALLALPGAALAHTAVTRVVPAQGAVVAAPGAVTLTFSEPVELRFSAVRVMAVAPGQTPAAAAKLALAARPDAPTLASRPPGGSGLAARLSVPLKPGLRPGLYVIAWKLLSGDGHPVSGLSTFRVR
ncbi:copper resistance CopC family protein [Deinococcus arcticus]|uniref:Copper resistance protein CopC n=1 Tax=Deinococcus arcticus TaxID=2136176 RepID=A0A2T3W994_9DEIO|nr:copper resistance CopC family protein [Deinococcus arcticus]PTA68471.1 copper resistance protein CopC [Deinococcus arcticus]